MPIKKRLQLFIIEEEILLKQDIKSDKNAVVIKDYAFKIFKLEIS